MPVTAASITYVPRWRVSVRVNWSDAWSDAGDTITPENVVLRAAPGISSAEFTWLVGSVKWEGDTAFADQSIIDVNGWFVKVEVQTGGTEGSPTYSTIFVGVFDFDATEIDGDEASAASNLTQRLTAFGMEYLLDRVPITSAWIVNDGETDSNEINTVPVFNELVRRGGLNPVGNRSDDKVFRTVTVNPARQSYVFGSPANTWTIRDICEYLTVNYEPSQVVFELSGQDEVLDDLELPSVELEGLTVWQALTRLISYRRGTGFAIRYEAASVVGDLKMLIHVFTVVESDVTYDTETLPANAEQVTDYDISGLEVEQAVQITAQGTTYGTIRVLGERIRSMFTLSIADGTLREGWDSTEETDYKAGGSSTVPATKDDHRSNDQYRRVFSHFLVEDAWNWIAKNGENGSGGDANPRIDPDGSINLALQAFVRLWGNSRQFLDRLPILKEAAYDGVQPEHLEPIGIIDRGSSNWCLIDKLGDYDIPSGHLRMLDNQMGVEVRFNPSHVLAKNHWSSAGVTSKPPLLDYDKLIVTVCAETDERLKVVVTVAGIDPARELLIEVRDAHFWWATTNTVVGVSNGALVRRPTSTNIIDPYPAGNIIRDDLNRLIRVAALAQAWYGRVRSAATFTVKGFPTGVITAGDHFKPGMLIQELSDSINTYAANTVVSEVAINVREGRTTVNTHYAEIDFVE